MSPKGNKFQHRQVRLILKEPTPHQAAWLRWCVSSGWRTPDPGLVADPLAMRSMVAAENLLALTTPLSDMIAQDRLHDIPGVGTAIADIIRKLHATGSHPTLDAMRKEIPEGVLEMLTIPGLPRASAEERPVRTSRSISEPSGASAIR